MVNPDKFIKGIYQFFRDITKPIKKNKQFAVYFEAIAYLQECSQRGVTIDDKQVFDEELIYSMIDLAFQGTEFLKKQDFDVYNIMAGLSSENEPIELRDPYAVLDAPSYYIEALFDGRPYDKSDANMPPQKYVDAIISYMQRFGYKDIMTQEDIYLIQEKQRLYNNTMLSMATTTNEYTVDMLPKEPLARCTPITLRWTPVFRTTRYAMADIIEALHHRRRTLPSNGAIIEFDKRQFLKSVKYKEVCRNDEIICIYKIETREGDLSGYYNTATEWFYSVLTDSNAKSFAEHIKELVLWLYASIVCDLPHALPTDESFRKSFDTYPDVPTNIKFMTIGGKPKNYLKKDTEEDSEFRIFDKSKYEVSNKNINGYIRKLPVGQKASERSIQIAESFGFELHEDETFVMPFVRRQWVTKKPKK